MQWRDKRASRPPVTNVSPGRFMSADAQRIHRHITPSLERGRRPARCASRQLPRLTQRLRMPQPRHHLRSPHRSIRSSTFAGNLNVKLRRPVAAANPQFVVIHQRIENADYLLDPSDFLGAYSPAFSRAAADRPMYSSYATPFC